MWILLRSKCKPEALFILLDRALSECLKRWACTTWWRTISGAVCVRGWPSPCAAHWESCLCCPSARSWRWPATWTWCSTACSPCSSHLLCWSVWDHLFDLEYSWMSCSPSPFPYTTGPAYAACMGVLRGDCDGVFLGVSHRPHRAVRTILEDYEIR